jgi:hypothetical protein
VSSASDVDPDIAAAFSGAPPSATSHDAPQVDPDIAAAFKSTDTAPEKKISVYDPSRPAIGDSLERQVHEMASGAYHSALGGYKGLGTLIWTRDPDQAADVVNKETAKAYQAPKADLSGAPAALRPKIEQMDTPVPATALGDFAAARGASAGLSTTLAALPTALSAMAVPRGGPELDATGAPVRIDPQSVVDRSFASQSMGAAGTAPNVSAASPELQQAVIDTARKTGGAVNPDVLQAHLEADSHGVQLMKGQATRDPDQFTAEQNSTHPDVVQRLNAQNGQMVDALDNIRREASPTTVGNDYIENGRSAVDALKQYDEPIQADIRAKYKALADANGGSMPVDGTSFVNQADADLKTQMKARYLPSEVRGTLDDLREGGDFSFANFENLRTDLAAASRKAEAAGDGNAKGAINITRNALEQLPLNGKTTQVGITPGVGGSAVVNPEALANLKNLADTARSAAKSRFDALDADPAYQAAVDDVSAGNKRGSPSPLADTFLDKYALSKSAPKSQVDLMMQKINATDPDAAGAVASHALNAVRKAAVNPNGNVLPNGYNGALQKLGPKLDSLVSPETQDSLESLGRTITRAKVEPAGGKVNYSRSGVVARDALQNVAEGIANAKTGGLYGIAKKIINPGDNAFAREALKPGAGLDQLKTTP